MEKVIKEWRIIETDDGYRIEIKGDKEALRHWIDHLRSFGPMFWGAWGATPWGAHSPRHWAHRMKHFGSWGAGFWGPGFWGCCAPDEECDEEDD